jgi:hypothetical protein
MGEVINGAVKRHSGINCSQQKWTLSIQPQELDFQALFAFGY